MIMIMILYILDNGMMIMIHIYMIQENDKKDKRMTIYEKIKE